MAGRVRAMERIGGEHGRVRFDGQGGDGFVDPAAVRVHGDDSFLDCSAAPRGRTRSPRRPGA